MKTIKVATIGDRGHASNVINIINNIPFSKVKKIYKPNAICEGIYTNNIDDIFQYDAIFILSPNDTHFEYLKILGNEYDGYVFCEKPPVTDKKDLRLIKNNPEKTFFNFNLRCSYLKDWINEILEKETIVKVDVIDSHGLAFKDIYKNSWRSNKDKHPGGVAETLAVHYIDLFIYLFGKDFKFNSIATNISNNGDSADTVNIVLEFNNKIVSIFSSYATPFVNKIEIITTESTYVLEGNRIIKRYPRDTFDVMGRFATPKNKKVEFIDGDFWSDSLSSSILFFLKKVYNKNKIPLDLFSTSIMTNKIILKI